MKPSARASFILFLASLVFFGAESYKKPPDSVLAILNAPMTPTLALNPAHTYALEARPLRNPPLAELSQPMLRLAGIRINPRTNGLHNVTFNATLALRRIPEGTEIKVALPPNPKLGAGRWSPDGSRFAFTNTTADGIELWIGAAHPWIADQRRDGRRRPRRRLPGPAVDARRQSPARFDASSPARRPAGGTRRPARA